MSKKKNKAWIWWTIAIIIAIGIIVYVVKANQQPGELDEFAQCIDSSGATFYGAFWCPHCQNQKKDFGSSAKYLPYIECSTPDGKGQKQICDDAGITGYPTWEFADGSRLNGEVALQTLADKTGCSLPINQL
ncbi:MAG: hypothetical protein ACKKL5_01230 [Candidatus Komeilibacteria bacterium]